ncbi:hypothetical protein M1O20_01110, partial [Dehalococcoidia bacterium]|nr:hypothetical protein [Dehalococcoidia bacterium]MCL0059107.1 hypothetical protein [Dehalococcoidia bacterium]
LTICENISATSDNTAYTLRAIALALLPADKQVGTSLPSVATSYMLETLSEMPRPAFKKEGDYINMEVIRSMTTKLDLTKEYKTYYTARTSPEVVEFGGIPFLGQNGILT